MTASPARPVLAEKGTNPSYRTVARHAPRTSLPVSSQAAQQLPRILLPKLSNNCPWTSKSAHVRPRLATLDQSLVDVGQSRPNFNPSRPNLVTLAQIWVDLGQIWPKLGRIWPNSVRFGPDRLKSGPNRSHRVTFSESRPESERLWPKTAKVGRIWDDDRIPGQLCDNFATSAPQLLGSLGARPDRCG